MKGMCDFLSRGFACLAVALMILSGLAMPTQGVRANDSSPAGKGGGTTNFESCACASGAFSPCVYVSDWLPGCGPNCPEDTNGRC